VRDFALQFALAAPADCIVLVGAATVEEFEQDYASATRDIPDLIWKDFCHEFHLPLPQGVGV